MASGKQIGEFWFKAITITKSPGPAGSVPTQVNWEGLARGFGTAFSMVTYVDGKSGTFSECATAYLDNGDDFQGARVTFDGGLILVRELDERLGLSELMDRQLSDSRRGKNIQLPLSGLLRQSNYSRLAGYERR